MQTARVSDDITVHVCVKKDIQALSLPPKGTFKDLAVVCSKKWNVAFSAKNFRDSKWSFFHLSTSSSVHVFSFFFFFFAYIHFSSLFLQLPTLRTRTATPSTHTLTLYFLSPSLTTNHFIQPTQAMETNGPTTRECTIGCLNYRMESSTRLVRRFRMSERLKWKRNSGKMNHHWRLYIL